MRIKKITVEFLPCEFSNGWRSVEALGFESQIVQQLKSGNIKVDFKGDVPFKSLINMESINSADIDDGK